MVRREEQPWQSRATVFIDNRRRAHRGQGPTASFERAVTVAASVALHLVARGYRVRLVTADPGDTQHAQQWHEHGVSSTEAASLLESLALLSLSDRLRIDTSWLGGTQQGGVVVAVLGECSTADEPALRHLQHAGDHALAVQLAVTQWGATTTRVSPASRGAAAVDPAWLRARGWRATEPRCDRRPWRGLALPGHVPGPAHPHLRDGGQVMARAGHGAEPAVTAAVLAALTTYATALGWYGLSVDPSAYTTPILLITLAVAAVGIGLRSLRLPRPVVVLLQTLLLLETLHLWWGGSQALAGVVPTPASLAQVGATVGRAVDDAQAWAAPVPDQATAFPPLMILIGGVVAVLVDAMAVTYRRPRAGRAAAAGRLHHAGRGHRRHPLGPLRCSRPVASRCCSPPSTSVASAAGGGPCWPRAAATAPTSEPPRPSARPR